MVETLFSPLGPSIPTNLAIRLELVGVDATHLPANTEDRLSIDPATISKLKPEARELLYSQTMLTKSGQVASLASGWELMDHKALSADEIDELDFLDRVKSGGVVEIDAVICADGKTIDINAKLIVRLPRVGGGIGYASDLRYTATLLGGAQAIVQEEPWKERAGWRIYSIMQAEIRRATGEPKFEAGPRTDRAVREWRGKGANFIVTQLKAK